MNRGAGWLLWIDPRQEIGTVAEVLERSIEAFRAKERWGGVAPDFLAIRGGAGAELAAAAADAKLMIVDNPVIGAGLYGLGVRLDG